MSKKTLWFSLSSLVIAGVTSASVSVPIILNQSKNSNSKSLLALEETIPVKDEPSNEIINIEEPSVDITNDNKEMNEDEILTNVPEIAKETEKQNESIQKQKDEEALELWEEFEEQLNESVNKDYSKSQRDILKLSKNYVLDNDFYEKEIFKDEPSLIPVWEKYYKESIITILDDIVNINKKDFTEIKSFSLSKYFWLDFSKYFTEIKEKLFIELSSAYQNISSNKNLSDKEKEIIIELEHKLTGKKDSSIIFAYDQMQKDIDSFISQGLSSTNVIYKDSLSIIKKVLLSISQQTFYRDVDKQELNSDDLSEVLFSNFVSSIGPSLVDYFFSNSSSLLPSSGTGEDESENPSATLNTSDISRYINFVFKLLNGKADYIDVMNIIPSNLLEGIPQSFYGIIYNTFISLIGNPFKQEGLSIKDFNFSLLKRILSVFDIANSIINLNDIINKSGTINSSFLFDWARKQDEALKKRNNSFESLSDTIIPIFSSLDTFLSGRLELANYNKDAQKSAIKILLDSSYKALSQFNLVEYHEYKDDSNFELEERVSKSIQLVDDENIKNVLDDTYLLIKNISPSILNINSDFVFDGYIDIYSNRPSSSLSKLCTNLDKDSISYCFNGHYNKFDQTGLHFDNIRNKNIKNAKSAIKSYAYQKINRMDSSYKLQYQDIYDDKGQPISFLENNNKKKNNLFLSFFSIIYGSDSKYFNSYKTMYEGLNILPGTDYQSLSPILSATLASFDNVETSVDFNIDNLESDYTPIVQMIVDLIKNTMKDNNVTSTIISSLLQMISGNIRPSEVLNRLSKVIPGVPWIPPFIINLLTKDFEKWLNSQKGYTGRFKGIFMQAAKLLTIKDKIFCSGIPVGSGYWYKAESAFSSAGLYKYFNIYATYNRQETGCWFFHRPSDIYSSTKYDPFTMLDNYVVSKLVATTNISSVDASKVLEDILFKLIGQGLNISIPGYIRPSFSK